MVQKRILIVAGDFVEDYELMVPYQMLLMVGYQVDVVSPDKSKGDTLATAIHDFEGYQTYTEKRGHNFTLNATYSEIKKEDYDGLFLPGGRCPEQLSQNDSVLDLIRYFSQARKPIAAVCHGPQLLAAANVISGYKISSYPACRAEMLLAGADYQNISLDDAITDRHFVTGPAWPAHPALIRQFLVLLSKSD